MDRKGLVEAPAFGEIEGSEPAEFRRER
jgi:hypothetical protein